MKKYPCYIEEYELEKMGRDNVLRQNPFQNPPPYEGLVGNLKGFFSRRINIQHRLVYQVYSEPVVEKDAEYEGTVKIIRMWSHYDGIGG